MKINKRFKITNDITLYNGNCLNLLKKIPDESVDLIITSPPYCIGKEYENPHDDIESFKKQHKKIFKDLYRILKVGGSICWQIGYHVTNGSIIPLDFYVYDIFTENNKNLKHPLVLRNRIIWTFGHGLNSTNRFSGRHETILWFTKGSDYSFDLDSVRIPQKYPGKKSYKGKNKGQLSGHPLGKNPSDLWEIPNVKAQHVEKTIHPCQFPVALPQRLIKALSPENGLILDPFMGVCSTGVAAVLESRKFVGAEIMEEYYQISIERINDVLNGKIKIRKDVPVAEPDTRMDVAKLPEEFKIAREKKYGN